MYDPFELCRDTGENTFEVDPAIMFPATIARIKEVLAGEIPYELMPIGETGHPLRNKVVLRFVETAESFPVEDWDKKTVDVLTFAESYFSRALALKVGSGIKLHIIKRPEYSRKEG